MNIANKIVPQYQSAYDPNLMNQEIYNDPYGQQQGFNMPNNQEQQEQLMQPNMMYNMPNNQQQNIQKQSIVEGFTNLSGWAGFLKIVVIVLLIIAFIVLIMDLTADAVTGPKQIVTFPVESPVILGSESIPYNAPGSYGAVAYPPVPGQYKF